jgi:hypothetical protein
VEIPGLLVEYLVSGCVALVWLLPLLQVLGYSPQKNPAIAALFLPGLYVLGMVVDFVGWFAFRRLKSRIKRKAYANLKPEFGTTHAVEIRILIYAPELAQASEMRSSRDRVARGTVVNAILGTVVLTLCGQRAGISLAPISIVAIGLLIVLLCLAMWYRFQRLSYDYEMRSLNAIQEKLQYERETRKA